VVATGKDLLKVKTTTGKDLNKRWPGGGERVQRLFEQKRKHLTPTPETGHRVLNRQKGRLN